MSNNNNNNDNNSNNFAYSSARGMGTLHGNLNHLIEINPQLL